MAVASARGPKLMRTEPTGRAWLARPILSRELTEDPPLEHAYVGLIRDKRNTSTAIQSISTILPGPNHLKRCSSNRLLLAPVSSAIFQGTEEEERAMILRETLDKKGFDLSMLQDRFELVKVAARPPRTKSQARRVANFWPVNFHPDPGLESVIDGSIFDDRQIRGIERYMRVAIDAARHGATGNTDCDGSSVIVDPVDGRILAVAASRIDQHPMWHASMIAVDLVAESQGGGAWKIREKFGKSDQNEGLVKRKHEDSSTLFYPSSLSGRVSLPEEEALIVETGSSLKREKSVERSTEENEKSVEKITEKNEKSVEKSTEENEKSVEKSTEENEKSVDRSTEENEKSVQKSTEENKKSVEKSTEENEKSVDRSTEENEKNGPYLCTGYWAFLLKEPCALCAMALLHSRISRIFYGVPNPKRGVLGSRAILHSVAGLNHRYRVWAGVLETECGEASLDIEKRIDSVPS